MPDLLPPFAARPDWDPEGVGPGQGTWRCHVCGDERPDPAIAVCKFIVASAFDGSAELEVCVRYCVDRAGCMVGATGVALDWAHLGKSGVGKPDPDGT